MALPKPILKATIICPGDRSVGIPETSFTVEGYPLFDPAWYGSQKEIAENLAWLRASLSGEPWKTLGDSARVHVYFDFELEEPEEVVEDL